MKKTNLWLVAMLLCFSGLAFAAGGNDGKPFPALIASARFVYVTTTDGPPESSEVLPEDRQALADVENEIQRWKGWTLVYRPQDADLILVVMSRGSEDVLWVYERGSLNGTALWWEGQRGGLEVKTMPILRHLESLVDQARAKDEVRH